MPRLASPTFNRVMIWSLVLSSSRISRSHAWRSSRLSQDVSNGSTGSCTVVQLAFSTDAGGFEQDASMMYFPLCFQLLGLDGSQARLTGLATGLPCRDSRQQVLLPL